MNFLFACFREIALFSYLVMYKLVFRVIKIRNSFQPCQPLLYVFLTKVHFPL